MGLIMIICWIIKFHSFLCLFYLTFTLLWRYFLESPPKWTAFTLMVFLWSASGGTKTKTTAVSKGRNEVTVIAWDMSNVYGEFTCFWWEFMSRIGWHGKVRAEWGWSRRHERRRFFFLGSQFCWRVRNTEKQLELDRGEMQRRARSLHLSHCLLGNHEIWNKQTTRWVLYVLSSFLLGVLAYSFTKKIDITWLEKY